MRKFMMIELHSKKRSLICFALLLLVSAFAEEARSNEEYQKFDKRCSTCKKLADELGRLDKSPTGDKAVDAALEVAKVIKRINLKGKKELEIKREIYAALNASIEVLAYDHDSQTVFQIIGVRAQAEKEFDFVFHRFPKVTQQRIVDRMKAFKEDKIKSDFEVPTVEEQN
jgi:hypothetical protein